MFRLFKLEKNRGQKLFISVNKLFRLPSSSETYLGENRGIDR